MKKGFLVFSLIFFSLIMISFSSAQLTELEGNFVMGVNATIKQSCADCTFVNFTQVTNSISEVIASNLIATQDGTIWSYTLEGSLLNVKGDYTVCGVGNPQGELKQFCYTFYVRPNSPFNFDLGTNYGLYTTAVLFIIALILAYYGNFVMLGVITFLLSVYLFKWEVPANNISLWLVFIFLILGLWAIIKSFMDLIKK